MPTPDNRRLYKPEYCELAHNYCLLRATKPGFLAGFFRVAPAPSTTGSPPTRFADAVYRGRAVADAWSSAPVRAAKGFSHKVTAPRSTGARSATVTNTVSYPPRHQRRKYAGQPPAEYWRARPQAPPEPEIVDDIALLRCRGESMRHPPSEVPDWRSLAKLRKLPKSFSAVFRSSGHCASMMPRALVKV